LAINGKSNGIVDPLIVKLRGGLQGTAPSQGKLVVVESIEVGTVSPKPGRIHTGLP
jgi:hypothetical protein